MRKFVSLLLLALVATPVFANFVPGTPVPEPESLSLLAIGAAAFMVSRRNKK